MGFTCPKFTLFFLFQSSELSSPLKMYISGNLLDHISSFSSQPAQNLVPPVLADGTASPVAPDCLFWALTETSAWVHVPLVPTNTTTDAVAVSSFRSVTEIPNKSKQKCSFNMT